MPTVDLLWAVTRGEPHQHFVQNEGCCSCNESDGAIRRPSNGVRRACLHRGGFRCRPRKRLASDQASVLIVASFGERSNESQEVQPGAFGPAARCLAVLDLGWKGRQLRPRLGRYRWNRRTAAVEPVTTAGSQIYTPDEFDEGFECCESQLLAVLKDAELERPTFRRPTDHPRNHRFRLERRGRDPDTRCFAKGVALFGKSEATVAREGDAPRESSASTIHHDGVSN